METLIARLQASWPKRMQLGLGVRISLLACGMALPFFVYTVFASIAEASVEREHASQQMLGNARLTAARLDDYVNDIRQLLRVLSVTVSADKGHTADNDAYLRKLEGLVPKHVSNISVWATDGDNIGTLDTSLRDKRPINLLRRKFFHEAMAGAELGVEAPVNAVTDGSLIGVFSVPLRQDGRTVGVVAVTTRLTPLQELLTSGNGLPAGSVVTITDVSGVVLARSIDPEKFIGRNLLGAPLGGVAAVLARREGTRDGPGADGIESVAGFTIAHAVPWLVDVGVPTDLALATVHKRFYRSLSSGAAVLLGGLFLAYLIGESIASPLRRVMADAQRFGRGELSHRIAVKGGGEVGVVAAALNGVADQVQERSEAAAASEHRMQMIADNMPALVAYVGQDERYGFVNAYVDRVFGLGPSNVIGRTVREVRGDMAYAGIEKHIRAALAGERVMFQGEWPIDGVIHHYQATYVPDLNEKGEVVGFFALTFDVSDMKRTQDKLNALARVDALTGLANRREFEERLRDAMERARRTENPMAVLFLDVDRFKRVNDTLGHGAGDEVLKEIARRLTQEVRVTDVVGRLAGDEFVIFLEGVSQPAYLKALAAKIVESMRTPFTINDQSLHVTTSVGVVSYHGDERTMPDLMAEADGALYAAKRNGRDGFVLARPALQLARVGWQASRY